MHEEVVQLFLIDYHILVLCLYREYWSNESFVDVLRMGIRYTAAKVFRRAEKVLLIIKVLIDTVHA